MLRPFWQRKPVWLRVVLFFLLAPIVVLWGCAHAAWDAAPEVWDCLLDAYQELITTPRSAR